MENIYKTEKSLIITYTNITYDKLSRKEISICINSYEDMQQKTITQLNNYLLCFDNCVNIFMHNYC